MLQDFAGAFQQTILPMFTRRSVPTFVDSFGPRSRAPNLRNNGALTRFRIVMFVMETSSSCAPATVSRASPGHPPNPQFEIAILMNPPFDSVPNIMRPVPYAWSPGPLCFHVPSSTDPSTQHPDT